MDAKTLAVPILVITVGVGWLLSSLQIAPDIDWVWSLGLAIAGVLALAVGGFDKLTLVAGGFLVTAGALSVLRQAGRLALDVEVPILVIVFGALWLAARHPSVPTPKWLDESDQK